MPALGPLALMAGVSFALSACVVFAVRQVLARHLVDVPNERSLHSRPTPRGGGIGVVLASCLLILAAVWLDYLQARLAYALVGCGLSIALVSLLDDAASLPQLARLAVHAAAAAVLVALVGGYRTAEVPFAGPITLGVTGWILPWLWLIACTNAFNFMDGIDGIAGGFAVVAGLAWVAVGYISGSPFPAVVGAIVAGSSLGFLPQNWSPARIFLGDVGSAFLGFTIGALPLVSNDRPALAFAAVLILWPFLFDTAFTLMRRSLNRERLMAPHRSHLYQRLVLSGWRHATVSLLYMAFGAITSASALWWIARRPFPELAAAGTTIAGAGVLIALVFCRTATSPRLICSPAMIFSVLTRSIVLVSAGAAALIVADAGAPAIPSLPVVCAVAMGAAVLASRISLRAALWIVLPAIYVTPAVFLLIKGHDHYAYRVVWMSALLGVIGSRGAAAPWNVPARWRWPLVTWATIIGLSWPLIAWRALDYTWPFVWDDKLPVVPGFSGPAAVAWIGYAAMAQLLGLLWIDWLYRTFGSVDDRFRRDVVAPLAVAIVLACVVGLYQVVVDAGFLSGHAWPRLHRAAGTLMDGNVFGMLSALWAPIFLVLILERSLGVAVGGSGFFLSWLGTWASGSRTALLTALIGSAVAAIHVPRRLRAAVGAAQWRVVAVVLVVGLVAAVALGPALSRSALERTRELLPSTSWASVQKTARALWERDGYGQAAVAMIREYPLSGVGPGAFYYLVHHYALAGTGHTLAGDNAQNWYRHQIAELGFIGSLGWLVWIAVVVFQVWPRRGRATGPGVLLRGPLLGFALASMLGMPGQDPAVAVTFWLLVFWCAADAGVVKSAAGMRVTTWLAVLLVVAGYLSATVRAADLRPPFLASRFGWAYAYGFVFDGPASARSAQHGVTVQPAEGPWLKLTYWVEHPDADSNLVRVEIWRDHDRIVRRRMSAHVPATAYVSVSAGKRFVLETKVDRTFHTGDPNGDAGLSLKWEFVQNPPGSPTSVSATPALPPPHNPGA